MKQLANNILRTGPVQWRKLKWLQGSLKSAAPEDAAKLKASLTKHGFIRPFKVWKNWILDGHLLQKTMQEMEAEGVKIPDKLPADFVRCKNLKHAKELVLVYSSFYHRVDEEQLEIYLTEADLTLSKVKQIINIPDIKFNEADEEEMKLITQALVPYKRTHILLSFHPDKFREIETHLNAIKKIEGLEIEQSAN
jgi:hypothetical protein